MQPIWIVNRSASTSIFPREQSRPLSGAKTLISLGPATAPEFMRDRTPGGQAFMTWKELHLERGAPAGAFKVAIQKAASDIVAGGVAAP